MPRHYRSLAAFALTLGLAFSSCEANVRLNSLFSDGAVLQRDREVPVWGAADDGEKVTVAFAGQTVSTTAQNGRWMVRLKPLTANDQPGVLTVTGKNTVTVHDVLVGEVWVASGQSNMDRRLTLTPGQQPIDRWQEEAAAATHPTIRQFLGAHIPSVQPLPDPIGRWAACTPANVLRFSAVGYFFARDLQQQIHVPIGIIFAAWGGTSAQAWTSREALEAHPELRTYLDALDKAKQEYPARLAAYQATEADQLQKWQAAVDAAKQKNQRPPRKPSPPPDPSKSPSFATTLYNGLIVPLQPYAIRGVIWYQGESNSGQGKLYRTLFPAMIADWRKAWGEGDFPFLYVQIAPFDHPLHPENDPEVREAQFLTLKASPDTAMTVITDAGDPKDIHPPHKQVVGARLALAARALAYGEKIEYSGPLFEAMRVEGSNAVITFTHTGTGLVARDGELKGFTIAGPDKHFVPAKAVIRGNEIVVSSDAVSQPAAVRFGWAKAPDVNLFNKEGLPASPFRTDSD